MGSGQRPSLSGPNVCLCWVQGVISSGPFFLLHLADIQLSWPPPGTLLQVQALSSSSIPSFTFLCGSIYTAAGSEPPSLGKTDLHQ